MGQSGTDQARQTGRRQSSAWENALALGLDMSLVEINLAKSPWERLKDHDQSLAFADLLRQAVHRPHEPT